MSEIFEIFDNHGKKIGTKKRSQVHSDGDWHRALEIHLVNPKDGSIIFQQRGKNKDVEPLKLGAAAAGHYKPGESFSDGLREVKEEIGLDINKIIKKSQGKFYRIIGERIFILTREEVRDKDGNILKNKIFNREFQDVGILSCEIELSQLKMQKEELNGLLQFRNQDILELFEGKRNHVSHIKGLLLGEKGKVIRYEPKIWKREDFTFNVDDYYRKISFMVKGILSGENLLPNWKEFK